VPLGKGKKGQVKSVKPFAEDASRDSTGNLFSDQSQEEKEFTVGRRRRSEITPLKGPKKKGGITEERRSYLDLSSNFLNRITAVPGV